MAFYGFHGSSLRSQFCRPTSKTGLGMLSRRSPLPTDRSISYLRSSSSNPPLSTTPTYATLYTKTYQSCRISAPKSWSFKRMFQHMAKVEETVVKSPPPSTTTGTSPPKDTKTAPPTPEIPTQAEQRRIDWGIVKRLMVNVWPKNDWRTRLTVLGGFALLVSAKVCICQIVLQISSNLF